MVVPRIHPATSILSVHICSPHTTVGINIITRLRNTMSRLSSVNLLIRGPEVTFHLVKAGILLCARCPFKTHQALYPVIYTAQQLFRRDLKMILRLLIHLRLIPSRPQVLTLLVHAAMAPYWQCVRIRPILPRFLFPRWPPR